MVAILSSLFVSFFLFVVAYISYLRQVKYAHIPGPPVKDFFKGNFNEFIVDTKLRGVPSAEFKRQCVLKYGKVVLIWIFHMPVVCVSSPELAKEVLVTKNYPKSKIVYDSLCTLHEERFLGSGLITNRDNQDWRTKRGVLNPAFHRKYLKLMIPQINSSCDILIKKLAALADGKTKVNILDEFSRLSLDVILKVGFGTDFDVILDETAPFSHAFDITLTSSYSAMVASLLDKLKMKFFTCNEKMEAVAAVKYLRAVGEKIVEERLEKLRNGEELPLDLLSCILKTCQMDNRTITMENFIDEFLTFFFAGHDTMSSFLSFFVMEISGHPEVEEKLVREMSDVMGERSEVEFIDLANLKYTGHVIKETLRLRPPVNSAIRVTAQEENLGGYSIPKNTVVDVNFYAISHHPDYFQEPFEFKPERWESDDLETSSHYTFMPFSVGPRSCIGQTLALIEAKITLTRLLREYKFSVVGGQETDRVVERVVVRPEGGVIHTLECRGRC